MDRADLDRLIVKFLDAWTAQDVERVLDCYTEDLRYRDRDAMRRYLTKLFAAWQMTWARREVFALDGQPGVAFLWRATFGARAGTW